MRLPLGGVVLLTLTGALGAPVAVAGYSEAHAAVDGFWVATTGSDANAGGANAPFKSIARAIAAVRSLPRPLKQTVTVHIAAGDYPLDEPLQLSGATDSGSNAAARIDYVAEGGRVRVMGGRVVPHHALHEAHGVPQTLPDTTRIIDLKSVGVTDFGKLTARGGCCNRPGSSGCPATGPLRLTFNSGPMHIARTYLQLLATLTSLVLPPCPLELTTTYMCLCPSVVPNRLAQSDLSC